MPNVAPFYAIKCNDDAAIVKTLADRGAQFDCASMNEISLALKAGATPDDIIFANPVKQIAHLRFAREQGVQMMTFDCVEELDKVKRFHPDALMLLRIATDDRASVCRFSAKFGAHPDSVGRILQHARDIGVRVCGVSYHVGSGCYDVQTYRSAVERAASAFRVAESLNAPMCVLDIGGGFPGSSFGTHTRQGEVALLPQEMSVPPPAGSAEDVLGPALAAAATPELVANAAVAAANAAAAAMTFVEHASAAEAADRAVHESHSTGLDSDPYLPSIVAAATAYSAPVDVLLAGDAGGDPARAIEAGEGSEQPTGATFKEVAGALNELLDIHFAGHAKATLRGASSGQSRSGTLRLESDTESSDTEAQFSRSPTEPFRLSVGDVRRNYAPGSSGSVPVMIMAEPGRFMVETSATLFANVIGRRDDSHLPDVMAAQHITGAPPAVRLFVNDGLYGSFNNLLYDHASPAPMALRATQVSDTDSLTDALANARPILPVPAASTGGSSDPSTLSNGMSEVVQAAADAAALAVLKLTGAAMERHHRHEVADEEVLTSAESAPDVAEEEREAVSVWGQTCDGIDCISDRIWLPKGLEGGDWLVFDSMGAYTKAAACEFNGFGLPVNVYIGADEQIDFLGEDARADLGMSESDEAYEELEIEAMHIADTKAAIERISAGLAATAAAHPQRLMEDADRR